MEIRLHYYALTSSIITKLHYKSSSRASTDRSSKQTTHKQWPRSRVIRVSHWSQTIPTKLEMDRWVMGQVSNLTRVIWVSVHWPTHDPSRYSSYTEVSIRITGKW